MGCDIHLFTEHKNHKGKWQNIDLWKLNPYFDANDNDGEGGYDCHHVYSDRNYGLFAALAGVRDYSEGIPNMGEAKGLPEDVSERTKQESDSWDPDGHSHSWHTLEGMKLWQAEHKTIKHSGLITPEAALDLDNGVKTPDSWCQGSSDKSLVHRVWEDECEILSGLITAFEERLNDIYYSFERDNQKDSDFRIVFWFDN